jgi:hypothetical protein
MPDLGGKILAVYFLLFAYRYVPVANPGLQQAIDHHKINSGGTS